VRILDKDENELALGVTNYSSDELALNEPIDQPIVDSEGLVCHLEIPVPVGL
jgi:glutamate 5-kinase